MKKIPKRYLAPNSITAANILLGYLSIIFAIKENYIFSAWLIIIAIFMDGMDGKVARIVNGFSEFGKEFDSFSDAMSFGMAPALLSYLLLSDLAFKSETYLSPIVIFIVSFLFLLCGVMRLVKFNIITVASKTKSDFSGLPIPGAAGLLASYIIFSDAVWNKFLFPNLFLFFIILTSFLMISTVPYKPALKIFSIKNNHPIFFRILVVVCIILVFLGKYTFLPLEIIYILSGIYMYLTFYFKEKVIKNKNNI